MPGIFSQRSCVTKDPTLAETGRKTQEAPSQGVLEGEEAETKLTEVL